MTRRISGSGDAGPATSVKEISVNTIRQGDVFLIPVIKIPKLTTEVPRDRGKLVLAYGEVTGHSHVIDAPPASATLLTSAENERFLRLLTEAPIVHEEHGTIQVAPGDYRVVIGREFTDDMAVRQVVD